MTWQREVYRASRLDEFAAYYLSGELWNGDEYTSDEFVRRMTTREERPRMAAGTAFHSLVERAGFGPLPAESDTLGWHIACPIDAVVYLPQDREIAVQRDFSGIPLFGKVDAINAYSVHDLKTTARIEADRYAESWQWRAYLAMTGRDLFVYHLFRVDVNEEALSLTVKDYLSLEVSRYLGMDEDVERLLVEFDRTVRALGIDKIMAAR